MAIAVREGRALAADGALLAKLLGLGKGPEAADRVEAPCSGEGGRGITVRFRDPGPGDVKEVVRLAAALLFAPDGFEGEMLLEAHGGILGMDGENPLHLLDHRARNRIGLGRGNPANEAVGDAVRDLLAFQVREHHLATVLAQLRDRLPDQVGEQIASRPKVRQPPRLSDEGVDGTDAEGQKSGVPAHLAPPILVTRFFLTRSSRKCVTMSGRGGSGSASELRGRWPWKPK